MGDQVFLRVSPMKGVMRFGRKGKLSPRYIGSYEILDRVWKVAYRLALPPELENVHQVFHVSMLHKYLPYPCHVIKTQEVQLDKMLSYEEESVAIIDKQVKRYRSKDIPTVKVIWRNHTHEEATWEAKRERQENYPHVFDI